MNNFKCESKHTFGTGNTHCHNKLLYLQLLILLLLVLLLSYILHSRRTVHDMTGKENNIPALIETFIFGTGYNIMSFVSFFCKCNLDIIVQVCMIILT